MSTAKIVAGVAGALVTTIVTSYFVSKHTSKKVAKATAKEVSEAYLSEVGRIVKESLKEVPINIVVNCEEGTTAKTEIVEKDPE